MAQAMGSSSHPHHKSHEETLDGPGLDGPAEGLLDGPADGLLDGPADGLLDGPAEGLLEGEADGELDGCGELEEIIPSQYFCRIQ